MLSDEKLAELEAAEAKATPGPWQRVGPTASYIQMAMPSGQMEACYGAYTCSLHKEADALLIALARNNLKALIDEVKAKRKKLVLSQSLGEKLLRAENNDLRAQLEIAKEALRLVALPMRSDGTYNRCREACEALAREALAKISGGGE